MSALVLLFGHRDEDEDDDCEDGDDEPVLPSAAVPPPHDPHVLRRVHKSLRRLRLGRCEEEGGLRFEI